MPRFLILAAPLLALAACGPSDKTAQGSTPGSAAGKPAAVSEPAPALVTRTDASGRIDRFTPHVGGPLALDEFSVGPIMSQTEFSLDAIGQRFPKAKVRQDAAHAGTGPVIIVEQGDGVLEIQGNPGTYTVGDIRVSGGTPQGPRGETLGLAWAKDDLDYPRCWMGKDRDARAVLCTQPGEPVLRYLFAVPGWTQDAMPPEATLRDKAVLRGFIWRGGAPTQ